MKEIWRKDIRKGCNCVIHQLLDADGNVLGEGVLKDEVRRKAFRLLATRKERLTFDEFAAISTVLVIRKGHGKKEYHNLVVDDYCGANTLHDLRQALRECHDLNYPNQPSNRKKFEENSIREFLEKEFSEHIFYGRLPKAGYVVFVKDDAARLFMDGNFRQNVLKTVYKTNLKMEAGNAISSDSGPIAG